MRKIVLTGAAGNLGMQLREMLSGLAAELLSTDIADAPAELLPNETWVKADLAEMGQIAPLMEGADMVVHFGAIVDEKPFEELLGPNYIGAYNVWEAAHRAGCRRVIYASSIHAVGMEDTNAGVPCNGAHRPDTFYGLAKCFAEDMGRMYWEKRGLEAVCIRILTCEPAPNNLRALGTWLSYGDLRRLVMASIKAPVTGFTTIFGVSANTRCPVDNSPASFLGYRPQDDAEDWAERIEATAKQPDAQDMGLTKLGGPFAKVPLGESGVDAIRRMTEGKA
ncbi:NAD-dependent epimerase/dehydratase family protein [Pseudoroseicyclus tamaricis]|uniref:NAD(P)-dependent oxidoreductase n=1 Tax=Pseudoroseicyclus tamaricis TaxID=2705421 RepID=A0A6B2JP29_9RHOB|nr:NAD(P)-dependent oxidoreductase [Pseudoroseicyclus tamaricis]NDU99694.1 NAD(P)-dependent oxidoreductase [Pseudoroseicyclus tamaricis]